MEENVTYKDGQRREVVVSDEELARREAEAKNTPHPEAKDGDPVAADDAKASKPKKSDKK